MSIAAITVLLGITAFYIFLSVLLVGHLVSRWFFTNKARRQTDQA